MTDQRKASAEKAVLELSDDVLDAVAGGQRARELQERNEKAEAAKRQDDVMRHTNVKCGWSGDGGHDNSQSGGSTEWWPS